MNENDIIKIPALQKDKTKADDAVNKFFDSMKTHENAVIHAILQNLYDEIKSLNVTRVVQEKGSNDFTDDYCQNYYNYVHIEDVVKIFKRVMKNYE